MYIFHGTAQLKFSNGLVKLNFPDFFEFSVTSTRGHAYSIDVRVSERTVSLAEW